MFLLFLFLMCVIMASFIYKLIAKFYSCACSNDLEKYIHALYQRYPKIDVDDIINLTQGLIEVQSIIDDGSLTTSLKADALSRLWTDYKKAAVPAVKDGELFWTNFLVENFINEETFYKHQEIYTFYNKIKLLVIDMPKKVDDKDIFRQIKYDVATILWLLNLLDQKGDCPSVVNVTSGTDHDTNYKKNDYAILSKYTLLDHSLRVADNIIVILEKEETGFFLLLPAIIAALGHDIGKIPEYFDVYKYTTYQHPSISIQILKKSPFVKSIPRERLSIIENAILHHHSIFKEDTANPILDKLKEADKMAREEELSLFVAKTSNSGNTSFSAILENNINLNFNNKEESNTQPEEYTETQEILPKEVENNNITDSILPKEEESNTQPEESETQDILPKELEKNNATDNMQSEKRTDNTETQTKTQSEDAQTDNTNVFQETPIKVQLQEKVANNSIEEENNANQITTKEKIKAYVGEKQNGIVIDAENLRILNSEEFLSALVQSIKEKINIVVFKNDMYIFNAFSFRNSVYVTPFFLMMTITQLCKQFNANDMLNQLIIEDKKKKEDSENNDKPFARAVLQAVSQRLTINDFVDYEMVKPNFIGGFFDVYDNTGNKLYNKAYYIVLKIKMFAQNNDIEDVIREIEERKRVGYNSYLLRFGKIVIHSFT